MADSDSPNELDTGLIVPTGTGISTSPTAQIELHVALPEDVPQPSKGEALVEAWRQSHLRLEELGWEAALSTFLGGALQSWHKLTSKDPQLKFAAPNGQGCPLVSAAAVLETFAPILPEVPGLVTARSEPSEEKAGERSPEPLDETAEQWLRPFLARWPDDQFEDAVFAAGYLAFATRLWISGKTFPQGQALEDPGSALLDVYHLWCQLSPGRSSDGGFFKFDKRGLIGAVDNTAILPFEMHRERYVRLWEGFLVHKAALEKALDQCIQAAAKAHSATQQPNSKTVVFPAHVLFCLRAKLAASTVPQAARAPSIKSPRGSLKTGSWSPRSPRAMHTVTTPHGEKDDILSALATVARALDDHFAQLNKATLLPTTAIGAIEADTRGKVFLKSLPCTPLGYDTWRRLKQTRSLFDLGVLCIWVAVSVALIWIPLGASVSFVTEPDSAVLIVPSRSLLFTPFLLNVTGALIYAFYTASPPPLALGMHRLPAEAKSGPDGHKREDISSAWDVFVDTLVMRRRVPGDPDGTLETRPCWWWALFVLLVITEVAYLLTAPSYPRVEHGQPMYNAPEELFEWHVGACHEPSWLREKPDALPADACDGVFCQDEFFTDETCRFAFNDSFVPGHCWKCHFPALVVYGNEFGVYGMVLFLCLAVFIGPMYMWRHVAAIKACLDRCTLLSSSKPGTERPWMPLHTVSNIIAWTAVCRHYQAVARYYRSQLEPIVAYWVVVFLYFAGILLYALFYSKNPVVIWLAAPSVAVAGTLLVSVLIQIFMVNRGWDKQADEIRHLLVALHGQRAQADASVEPAAFELLERISVVAKKDAENGAVTIFGVGVSRPVIGSMGSVVVTAVSALVSRIT